MRTGHRDAACRRMPSPIISAQVKLRSTLPDFNVSDTLGLSNIGRPIASQAPSCCAILRGVEGEHTAPSVTGPVDPGSFRRVPGIFASGAGQQELTEDQQPAAGQAVHPHRQAASVPFGRP